jgi:hypothetical protein
MLKVKYQGNPERNHRLWNIVSTDIYIYTLYAGAAGMLLHVNGKFTMWKLEIISFVVKCCS